VTDRHPDIGTDNVRQSQLLTIVTPRIGTEINKGVLSRELKLSELSVGSRKSSFENSELSDGHKCKLTSLNSLDT